MYSFTYVQAQKALEKKKQIILFFVLFYKKEYEKLLRETTNICTSCKQTFSPMSLCN